MIQKKKCVMCGEFKAVSYFPISDKPYTKKSGEIVHHRNPERRCKACRALRRQIKKVEGELITKVPQHSGTTVTLRLLLYNIKRRIKSEQNKDVREAWCIVGLQLNGLLLRL